MPLKNQAPLFFHISLVSAQIRQRNCFCALPWDLWTILWTPARSWANLMTRNELRDEVAASFSSPFPFVGLSLVASMPHFWQIYLRQSLQRLALAPNTPNFSPQSAHEQMQRTPPEHRLPQPRLSFDLVDVTMHTFRFIFSSLSTSLPTRSCSDKSKASALCITCENILLGTKNRNRSNSNRLKNTAKRTPTFLRIWKLISFY